MPPEISSSLAHAATVHPQPDGDDAVGIVSSNGELDQRDFPRYLSRSLLVSRMSTVLGSNDFSYVSRLFVKE